MYELGSYIVYGKVGVCTVESVGTLNTPGMPKDRVYYTLNPYYAKGSTIFIPADNQKVLMRPVMDKDEAAILIERISDMNCLEVTDEKQREGVYREIIVSCDCHRIMQMIKTIHIRRHTRIREGKKLIALDEKYLRVAEENLYGELAISLEKEKVKIGDFLADIFCREVTV